MKWLRFLFSLMPDLSGFKELGFESSLERGQLFIRRSSPLYDIYFSQGFEPDHPRFGRLVDFEIPDGFIAVVFKEKRPSLQNLDEDLDKLFSFRELRENTLFLYDYRLDFNSAQINVKMEKLISLLERT